MGKIIAVINEKGGVAKTTTVKNLAGYLAKNGYKVLAIDLDSSANLTLSLGLKPTADTGSIVEIIDSMLNFDDPLPPGYGIIRQDEGIDVICSDIRLLKWTERIRDTYRREEVLKRYIDGISDEYDYILIDCPGGLEIFTQNALFASDYLIVPTEATKLSIEAMQNIFITLNMIYQVKQERKPEIAGILFCLVRPNTLNNRAIMKYARENYADKVRVFDSFIPLSTTVSESDIAGKSVFEYDPKSSAAEKYANFADELIKIMEGDE